MGVMGKIRRMKRGRESQKQGEQNILEKLGMSNEHTGGLEERRLRNYSGRRLCRAARKQGSLPADRAESTAATAGRAAASLALAPFSFTFRPLHVDLLPSGATLLSSLK